jgi:hypothetical protein
MRYVLLIQSVRFYRIAWVNACNYSVKKVNSNSITATSTAGQKIHAQDDQGKLQLLLLRSVSYIFTKIKFQGSNDGCFISIYILAFTYKAGDNPNNLTRTREPFLQK